jgi:diguanylate cyclase (GGDEF)-like protein
MWIWLVPRATVLIATGLMVGMVYLALVVPRPYAEIGLCLQAATYVGGQTLSAGWGWQPAGTAVTAVGVGLLLLGIRLTTERQFNAHTAALAAANGRLEALNRTDPLTGLANRRHLEQALTGAWTQAAGSGTPVSAIMIDIDFFKQFNDHYGHLAGDECLRQVADVIANSARASDPVARFGGEEFAIVLAGADLAAAAQIAERVRADVASLRREHHTSPEGFVTISVGVASVRPDETVTPADLLHSADRCLYAAKRDGRNRTIVEPADSPAPAYR